MPGVIKVGAGPAPWDAKMHIQGAVKHFDQIFEFAIFTFISYEFPIHWNAESSKNDI